MSDVKDFDAEFKMEEKRGVSFILRGREFHTKKLLSVKDWKAEKGNGLDYSIALIKLSLVAEDRDAFQAIIDDEDGPGPFQIDQIATFIWEKLSGRPTVSPEPSGPGPVATNSGSTENSASPATIGS